MTAVERYVDALLGLRAIERAIHDEGETPARLVARTNARAELRRAEGKLNGSQLGAARRLLATRRSA